MEKYNFKAYPKHDSLRANGTHVSQSFQPDLQYVYRHVCNTDILLSWIWGIESLPCRDFNLLLTKDICAVFHLCHSIHLGITVKKYWKIHRKWICEKHLFWNEVLSLPLFSLQEMNRLLWTKWSCSQFECTVRNVRICRLTFTSSITSLARRSLFS